MWQSLEVSYNNNKVTQMENDLKSKQIKLVQLQDDTGAMQTVEKNQKDALKGLGKNKENSAKMSNLNNKMR